MRKNWREITFGDIPKKLYFAFGIFLVFTVGALSSCGSDGVPTNDNVDTGFINKISPNTGDTWECLVMNNDLGRNNTMWCEVQP